MARKKIAKLTYDTVMKEYSYCCAICGTAGAHMHHIDEDHSNNDPYNLLPLCPNCHLNDQHNPTKSIELGILKLFRKHRDPAILTPQFHAIYRRFEYLLADEIVGDEVTLENQCWTLLSFVNSLEMGSFYAEALKQLIERTSIATLGASPFYGDITSHDYERERKRHRELESIEYRKHLAYVRDSVTELIVEMLRFQGWLYSPSGNKQRTVITVSSR